MIEVKKIAITDIAHLYPEIYLSVFDEIDPFQCPSIVYLGFENGNYIGFLSGYLHNARTFLIQYAGLIREHRGYKTLVIFREAMKEIEKEYRYIMCLISNKNSSALRLTLKEGFLIHGIRQDTLGDLYVELIKEA